MAALPGGRLIVHCINRKNAPFLFFHMTGDTTCLSRDHVFAALSNGFSHKLPRRNPRGLKRAGKRSFKN